MSQVWSASAIIRSIEAELAVEYHPQAFAWIDKHRDGAFSRAVDRFEQALVDASRRFDHVSMKIEADLYKNTMLEHLRAYKKEKQMDDADEFLASLEKSSLPIFS